MTEQKWRFWSRKHAIEKVSTLWLYPELDGSYCVDNAEDQSGEGQLAYHVETVRRDCSKWWTADAVPILWSVVGDEGIHEYAPCLSHVENFLTFWSPPVDAKTGEKMNWWRLPVRNARFPAFAKALGWAPSPFQEFAPLRSIVTNATTRETVHG